MANKFNLDKSIAEYSEVTVLMCNEHLNQDKMEGYNVHLPEGW